MLDIKLLREDKQTVLDNLAKRGKDYTTIINKILEIDEQWRSLKKEVDTLKSLKNKESKAIAQVKKEGGDIKEQIAKVKAIGDEIENKDAQANELLQQRDSLLITIPALLDDEVPIGEDEEGNVPIKTFKEKPTFSFPVRNHMELCELNGWYDLEKAAEHSGARFYYLKGELVELELALYQFVFSKLTQKNYIPVEVPVMLRREAIGRSVSLEAFEEDLYKIEGEDLYLIATSEHSLALLHANDTLNHKDLPLKYAGISPCYRKEAGVTKDSKGIFRVHHFNKIEQFIFCKPEESNQFLQELVENAESIFQDLDIHYQIIDICTGDIGSFAARKYDLEAWLPSQEKYREMVSASNYKDYGARRLHVRYQNQEGKLELVHTLNSTAIALTRCMIAIMEQHQTEDGNVRIPEKLRPYLGGREFLKK
jgi:seryl-tRNA synthetase